MSDFCQINLLKFNSNPKSGGSPRQFPKTQNSGVAILIML